MRFLVGLLLVVASVAGLAFLFVRQPQPDQNSAPADPGQDLEATSDLPVPFGSPSPFAGAIRGHVVDEWGDPVAGADVQLRLIRANVYRETRAGSRGAEREPFARIRTGAAGAFRFEELDPERTWSLVVSCERFVRWSSNSAIPVRAGVVWTETITLVAERTLRGTVRDARSGEPIAGARVTLGDRPRLPGSTGGTPAPSFETRSDANGAYAFERCLPGWVLTISAPGRATRVVWSVGVSNGEPTRNIELDLALAPGHAIAGRVVGLGGVGAPGIDVEASASLEVGSAGSATTGADGSFRIEGLARGEYRVGVVSVALDSWGPDAVALERVPAGATDQRLVLLEPARVIGTVVDPEGRPVTDYFMRVCWSHDDSGVFGGAARKHVHRRSPDGTFEIDDLRPGHYSVEAVVAGFAPTLSAPFHAEPGATKRDVVVRLSPGGSIAGRVLDASTGAAVAGATISVLRGAASSWVDHPLWTKKTTTGPAGDFVVGRVAPGTYRVSIGARGFARGLVEGVQVEEGRALELAPERLTMGASLTGLVLDRAGKPAPGATVQLHPSDGVPDAYRVTRCDTTGRFAIELVRPGPYELNAMRADPSTGDPFVALREVMDSQVEIELAEGARLEIDLYLGGQGSR